MIPGTLLKNRYQLVRKLGEGGEGETFIAWDRELQRKVVVKFQLARVTESTETYTAYGNDIVTEYGNLHAMLEVPGMPEIFDIGSHGNNERKFLVMELIDGVTLDSWIQDHHPVPTDSAVSVIAQLCETLHVLHEKKYIHRDITPKNVMLQPDGRIRLLDVGIAIKNDSKNVEPRGTQLYSAPEQFIEGVQVTARADIFALGALLFKMATSKLPYSDLEYPFKSTPPPFPSNFSGILPKPLWSLGISMVAINPEERPNGAAEVLSLLHSSLPKPGSHPSPKAPRPDPTLPYRRLAPQL
ncbi:serine/threonine protein kinase [Streptomyces acidiscabies]|uniref:non-specific serine/threonine protein kinase n=1 Tax=Streptomyces acidiscabies TaxID=42234 RepID=A0AAP6BLG1_9ACTN|nr:serine/threonine-protein kinase [Streptomyces acidiscabies]MBP5936929.1 serine/threonine protein kinase [Streptomyces sp. LBUM 1476]MBZ3915038.1 serine/threonine protein kinase [Streptomyces acidiscabies]MDX2966840.1 serine/threonine-protein kinase [Streptomyces acidiscabies]MDX3025858.1 serine/threonine-protein kinase [Streptomyces acidiscabies]MDX3796793.1 serine/threonine-protein kinase [Streptomyces acidiscabies]